MSNHQARDFSKYDSMSKEELEEILRADLDAPEGTESDTEMLFYVMEVLAQRRLKSDNPGKSTEEAWESFVQNYLPCLEEEEPVPESKEPPKTGSIRWLRRLSAVAAAIALVFFCTVTASALGFDVLDVIVKWTQETFQFGSVNSEEMCEPAPNHELEYASLQEALDARKITTPLAPTMFPKGTELVAIEVMDSPVQEVFFAHYIFNNIDIKIQIKNHLADDAEKVEQSDDLEEVYECDGVTYYIFLNYNMRKAVWIVDDFECYISGELTIEEMKTMIDSIREG